jgi:hypothetical protein
LIKRFSTEQKRPHFSGDTFNFSSLSIDFSDFVIGDPVFDYLLFTQTQRAEKGRLEDASLLLEGEIRSTKRLHQIAVDTYALSDPEHAYEIAIRSVCETLEWDAGHVYLREYDPGDRLVSSSISHISDPEVFGPLPEATNGPEISGEEELSALVLKSGKTTWLSPVPDSCFMVGRPKAKNLPQLTGVGVPITLNLTVAAVLEFYTRNNILQPENALRPFEAVGMHLSNVVARQHAQENERTQIRLLVQAFKMATLGELAAGVAHEIKTPLHTASLVSKILQRLAGTDSLPLEQLDVQISRLNLCLERIGAIVSDLQGFSRDSSQDSYEMMGLRNLIEQSVAYVKHGLIRMVCA